MVYVLWVAGVNDNISVEICKALNDYTQRWYKYPDTLYLHPEIEEVPEIQGPPINVVYAYNLLSKRHFAVGHSKDKLKIQFGDLKGKEIEQWC